MSVVEEILDSGRWAPSGDNTQPWRFEIVDDQHFIVYGFDTREHCVYDLDGHASQLAIGCLLETLAITASSQGFRLEISRRGIAPEYKPTFDISLLPDSTIIPDPLVDFIQSRTVQRRAMALRALTVKEKGALQEAISPSHKVVWVEGWEGKWRAARLMFANAKVRLTMPEAYLVHRAIIEWDAQFSETMVPDQAVGLDSMTLRLMRWAMHSWERVNTLNTYFMGTLIPRLQLDLIPGIACGAHLAIVADKPPIAVDDYVEAGRAVQRVWLTATRLGLQLQPEMTPVIFSRFVREGQEFTAAAKPRGLARRMASRFEDFFPGAAPRVVFMARVGAGPVASARSLRLPLPRLLQRR